MPAPDSFTPDELAALLADPTAAGVIKALAAGFGLQPTAASTVPTVREYHPTVLSAATPATHRTYSTYWKLLVSTHCDKALGPNVHYRTARPRPSTPAPTPQWTARRAPMRTASRPCAASFDL